MTPLSILPGTTGAGASWRAAYQQGSFRGAAFRTAEHQRSGGRRVASHEFPGRDEPLTEDLGRRQRQFQVDCHVIGDGYVSGRDALIEALEAEGPGLLVHPWHGQMMVVVLEFTSSESTEDGGLCHFDITFAEAGQPVAAPVSIPTGRLAGIEADKLRAGLPGLFAGRFSVAGAASFVEASAGSLITGMVSVSQLAAGLQGGVGPALRAFDAGLRLFGGDLGPLLRTPLNLAHSVLGLVNAVSLLGTTPRGRVAALSRMVDWQPSAPVYPERTAQRQIEADNRDALLYLFRTAAAGELVRAASSATYASYEDAVTMRDQVAGQIDVLAVDAADRGDDVAAEGFDRLRRAVVRDITVRSASLERLYSIRLGDVEPALAVANRLYGAAGVESRADEIAARNRIPHPGFVPPGRSLEVRTADGGVA